MPNRYVPPDNQRLRDTFEANGGGICGVAVLAALKRTTVSDILQDWKDYPGHAPMKDMRRMLNKYGYNVVQRNGRKARNINLPPDTVAICRVQWLGGDGGSFHGYNSWVEASRNTHCILIEGSQVYCNVEGWFPKSKLPGYLKEGYITSYLEVV
jgi:hypothetical protein